MARESGAKKVYFASAAPPVRFQNVYGIDMPTVEELIAHGRSEEEVAQIIGADRLIYQNLEDLIESASAGNPEIRQFDTSCFTGDYVTGDISSDYLDKLSNARNEAAKTVRDVSEESVIDLSFSDSGAWGVAQGSTTPWDVRAINRAKDVLTGPESPIYSQFSSSDISTFGGCQKAYSMCNFRRSR